MGLGLGEVCARWLKLAPAVQAIKIEDPNSPYQRSSNPVLRYELKPGYSGPLSAQHEYLRLTAAEFQQDSSSAVAGTVTVNSFGFRDRERQVRNSYGSQRVVLLGDSVVEMINYVSDESTISRLLENKFEDKTEVLNVGTAGYCTKAEVELLKQKALQFQPDTVVVLFVENDYWGYNLEHAIGTAKVQRPSIVNKLFVASDLFRAASLQGNLFGFADEQDPAKWHRDAVGENNVVSGFQQLRTLADQHDFEVIVAFWPSFFKQGVGYRYILEGSEELVAEPLAWKFGFPTVRLDQFYLQHWATLKPQPQPEWYYACGDGMHPSVAGCQLAADALYSVLTDSDNKPNLIRPDTIADIDTKFENAANVAAMLALKPESTEPLAEQISMTMKRQNRFVEAERFAAQAKGGSPEEMNQLLASDSETADSYFAAGLEFLSQSQQFAARDMFERVAALNPQHVDARLHLAKIFTELNLKEKARQCLHEVLAIDSTNAEADRLLQNLLNK